jgi:N-acetylneuraminate synthase
MESIFIIAECGINHNGNIDIAKEMIKGAKEAGVNCVKFQKRNVEKVYSKEELDKPRESPWGTTNREQKLGLEFTQKDYEEINRYCKELGIPWIASAWDLDSVEFLKQFDLPYNKIASARLGHIALLEAIAKQGKKTFISTGMTTIDEIKNTIQIFKDNKCPYELMHCNSQYPLSHTLANLKTIKTLKQSFNTRNVGYSCHTPDIITPCAAVAMGATSIEKHITLNRTMYGSDQAASVEIIGLKRLVDYIRSIEEAMGDGKKIISPEEQIIRNKLWRTTDYNG